ncbi:MAG: hypothetical protein ACFCU1_13805 [Sumerlaeia bacterium]
MKQLLLLPLFAICLLTLVGCSKRSSAPDYARIDEEAIVAAKAPVNILDADLRNKVAADIASASRLPDGRLEAKVSLRNSTKKDLNALVRIVFKDANALSTNDETEWEFIYFAPQQIVTYQGRSRETNAVGYTIEVRKP